MATPSFQWPWQYNFPPFFTIQPNEETRAKQLDAWQALVLSYTQHHKVNRFVVNQCTAMDLFNNKAINRSLNTDAITTVLDHMQQAGHIEWKDADKTECAVFWRSPKEWGDIIYKWAVDTGNTDTVCTFFELLEGETGEGQAFFNMDRHVFRRALAELQTQGKAEIFSAGAEDEEGDGVKFFML